jgi:glucuronide carrier protein
MTASTAGPAIAGTIRWLTGGAPAVFVGIGAVIMLAYPLTEQRFPETVSELALRHRTGALDRETPA